jgi:hypothetical protein
MGNNGKDGRIARPSKARMGRLAKALVNCATPDVYFDCGESLQQINVLPFESGDYTAIAPEQLWMLTRVQDFSSLTQHTKV